MPDAMRAKPRYEIPDVKIEMVEWVPNGRYPRKPATEIKHIPTPQTKTRRIPRGRRRLGGVHRDEIREVSMNLNAHVVTTATLKPEQWGLIGGATLIPSTRLHRFPDGRRIRAYAYTETHLPTRTITVDLVYPLHKIARVTIRPYKQICRRGTYEEMSVGYVLWQLARAYKAVYKKYAAYGVWGHAITDLVFEIFELKDNIGYVSIGS